MGMGSYKVGAEVKIPFQITDGGIAITDTVPIVEKIVTPTGAVASGFPANMAAVDSSFGTYEYSYTPEEIGDYIVIISILIDDDTYVSLENFTVGSATSGSGARTAVPRAESR